MKKTFFLLLFALPLALGFNNVPTASDDCSCGTPTNVLKTGSTSTSITFAWNTMDGASYYKAKYVRLSDSYASSEWTTTATSYTFTGLTAGSYKFYFATVCGGEESGFIVIDDIIGN